jgi:uncharacterized membrane protein YsdA (DUF1294 family)
VLYIAIWYILLSAITFTVYGIDKRKATRGTWRIKEQTLHLLDLFGGWPGGFAAQRYFHHKSKKTKFQIVFWMIVAVHLLAWGYVAYRRFIYR